MKHYTTLHVAVCADRNTDTKDIYVSHVACPVSPVTCHMSLTPTDTGDSVKSITICLPDINIDATYAYFFRCKDICFIKH